jgi:hypothetical protein
MIPNATVSTMVRQTEQRLVEAKAARTRIADEAATNQTAGPGPLRLPMRLVTVLAARVAWHRGTGRTAPSRTHGTLGAVDSAR